MNRRQFFVVCVAIVFFGGSSSIATKLDAQTGSCTTPLYGEFDLQFTAGIVIHRGTLAMNGCSGVFTVRYFDGQKTQSVTQTMRMKNTAEGMLWLGYNPVHTDTGYRHSDYNADNFLFRLDTDGLWTAGNCDDDLVCSPVKILAVRMRENEVAPSKGIRLESKCDKTISVAIIYKNSRGDWIRAGWWKLEHGKDIKTDVVTGNRHVYFFGEASGLEWNGKDDTKAIEAWVVSDKMNLNRDHIIRGNNLRKVNFFHTDIGSSSGEFTQQFSCEHRHL